MKRNLYWFMAAATVGLAGCGGGGGGGGGGNPALAVFISPAGNDATGDGTAAKPYRTFKKALTDPNLSTVQKISAATGTYDAAAGETFPLAVPANVTLEGSGAGATDVKIIGGATNATIVTLTVGSTIKNLQVTNADPTGTTRAVSIIGGSGGAPAKIDHCRIEGAGTAASHCVDTSNAGFTYHVLSSTLENNGGDGLFFGNSSTTAVITSNTFVAGIASAIHFGTGSTSTTTATVRSNTFNTSTGPCIWVENGSVNAGANDVGGADPGNNNFTGAAVYMRDSRTTGAIMLAKGNSGTPVLNCGTNVLVDTGSPGWDIGVICESGTFVDPTAGSDATGDGTSAKPYKSLGFAIAHRVPNLPILLKAGIYTSPSESFPITVPAGVRVQGLGAGPVNCRIVGGTADATVFDIPGNGTTLKNIQVESSYNAGAQSRAIWVHGQSLTLDTCNVFGTGSTNPQPNGVEFDAVGSSGTFTGCNFRAPGNICVLLNADASVSIASSTFTNCESAVVGSGPGNAPSATIRSCTFTGTGQEAIKVLKGTMDLGTVSDDGLNTFVACSIDLADQRTSGAQMTAIDNTFSSNPPVCGTNIVVNPGSGGWAWRVTGGASGTCP